MRYLLFIVWMFSILLHASEDISCSSIKHNTMRLECYDNSQLSICQDIESPIERLRCFDERTAVGKWKTEREIDPFSEKEKIVLSLKSNNTDAVLYIVCYKKKMLLEIDWGTNVETDVANVSYTEGVASAGRYREASVEVEATTAYVTTKMGSKKPESCYWALTKSKKRTRFMYSAISYIRRMYKEDTFIVKIHPIKAEPIVAEFDISGLREAVKPLKRACGW